MARRCCCGRWLRSPGSTRCGRGVRGRADRSLTDGPGKLCQALGLDLRHDGLDLCAPAPRCGSATTAWRRRAATHRSEGRDQRGRRAALAVAGPVIGVAGRAPVHPGAVGVGVSQMVDGSDAVAPAHQRDDGAMLAIRVVGNRKPAHEGRHLGVDPRHVGARTERSSSATYARRCASER